MYIVFLFIVDTQITALLLLQLNRKHNSDQGKSPNLDDFPGGIWDQKFKSAWMACTMSKVASSLGKKTIQSQCFFPLSWLLMRLFLGLLIAILIVFKLTDKLLTAAIVYLAKYVTHVPKVRVVTPVLGFESAQNISFVSISSILPPFLTSLVPCVKMPSVLRNLHLLHLPNLLCHMKSSIFSEYRIFSRS